MKEKTNPLLPPLLNYYIRNVKIKLKIKLKNNNYIKRLTFLKIVNISREKQNVLTTQMYLRKEKQIIFFSLRNLSLKKKKNRKNKQNTTL